MRASILLVFLSGAAQAGVVTLDPTPLASAPGNATVFIAGFGGAGAFSAPRAVELPDGTYSVVTGAEAGTYGTFTLAGGAVSEATGSLVHSGHTVGFDPSMLAEVTIDPTPLSVPVSRLQISLFSTRSQFVTAGSLRLPDGTYELTTAGRNDVRQSFGTFTVSAGVVSSVTGSLTRAGNAVGFDLARLAEVTLDPTPVSVPAFQATLFLFATRTFFRAPVTLYLPPGDYEVFTAGLNDVLASFGAFTVGGRSVESTAGSLTAAGGALTFDRSRLTRVALDASPLSSPSGSLPAMVFATRTVFRSAVELYLPAGLYDVFTVSARRPLGDLFGSFEVMPPGRSGTGRVRASGALRARGGGALAFDPRRLQRFRVVPTGPDVAWSLPTLGLVSPTGGALQLSAPEGSHVLEISSRSGRFSEPFAIGPEGPSETGLPRDHPLVALEPPRCYTGPGPHGRQSHLPLQRLPPWARRPDRPPPR